MYIAYRYAIYTYWGYCIEVTLGYPNPGKTTELAIGFKSNIAGRQGLTNAQQPKKMSSLVYLRYTYVVQ